MNSTDRKKFERKRKDNAEVLGLELTGTEDVREAKRVPRKKGQHRGSKSHSDLYTDENPKGTIKGLKFATVADAKASVSKINGSGKSHAHKIQAAVAMEQRAKEMGKTSQAAVYRAYINKMKKITKKRNENVKVNHDGKAAPYGSGYEKVEEKCQKGYKTHPTRKTKKMFGKRYRNCVKAEEKTEEGWSKKYKKSIDCSNPKGFSQKAHCAGKKKKSENVMKLTKSKLKEMIEEEYFNYLVEKNVPTNPSKWSYYKAQAKKKFDVYPSAYANAWAAKMYKKAGGGWKKG